MNTSTKGAVLSALLTISGCAAADTVESAIDKADVAWMLVATTLVLFMTIPGIALFYGGMSRKKNVLSVLAQTTVICCALTLLWFVAGYSLAFAPGNAFVGGLDHVFLRGIDIKSTAGSIPTYLFVIFQMTFAVLTAALMIGSFAGRMKFSAMLVFMLLWSAFVYAPICHWVWAEGGIFFEMGALDYAGGTVVHINAGIAGLVGCLVIGKRLGYGREAMSPHNLTFTMIAPACCGSVGSDLTAVRGLRPMSGRCWRFLLARLRRLRPAAAGWPANGFCAESLLCSAWSPVPWQGSW